MGMVFMIPHDLHLLSLMIMEHGAVLPAYMAYGIQNVETSVFKNYPAGTLAPSGDLVDMREG